MANDRSRLDEVTNIVLSRMVDMQVDEGLPVYIVPDRPLERIRAYLHEQRKVPAEARHSV